MYYTISVFVSLSLTLNMKTCFNYCVLKMLPYRPNTFRKKILPEAKKTLSKRTHFLLFLLHKCRAESVTIFFFSWRTIPLITWWQKVGKRFLSHRWQEQNKEEGTETVVIYNPKPFLLIFSPLSPSMHCYKSFGGFRCTVYSMWLKTLLQSSMWRKV